MNKNIGIIGAGFAKKVYMPAFSMEKRCKVYGVTARTKESTLSFASEFNLKAYDSWRDLVSDPEIDIVAIAVPPPAQPEILLAAAENGKAIFCEKSLATTPEQSEQLLKIVESKKLPNAIDFEFMELDVWKKTKELIQSGKIGKLRGVEISWAVENASNKPGAQTKPSWKNQSNQGGGVLNNFVSHSFYYIEALFPPIKKLICELGAEEKSAHFLMKLEGNIDLRLNMYSHAFAGAGHRFDIYGSEGSLSLHNSTLDYMKGFLLKLQTRDGNIETIVSELSDHPTHDGRIQLVHSIFSRFIDGIDGTSEFTAPLISHGDRVERLLDLSRQSNREKHWVET